MTRCGGVIDVPTLEHALTKAKDKLAKSGGNPRAQRKLEGQVHHLSALLEVAKAAKKYLERQP